MNGYVSSVDIRAKSPSFAASERRAAPRKAISVRARVVVEGAAALDVDTIDLSHGGVCITSRQPLNLELSCIIEIAIGVPELGSPPLLRAAVCYCARLKSGKYRIGLKFTHVSIEAAELIVAALG